MSNPFVIGNTYNFSTYAPAILGAEHNNMVVKGIFGYDVATSFTQPDVKHSVIYPYLVDEGITVANDPVNYTYVLFKAQNGSNVVLALEWIKLLTVIELTTRKLIIEIDDAKPGDDAYFRDTLLQAGAKNVTIR